MTTHHAAPAPHTPGDPDDSTLIRVRDLQKTFTAVDATITALAGIDLDIRRGSITALVGPSGSGKSTLLHLLGALDTPDHGTITVDGTTITGLRGDQVAAYRRRTGFVFQHFHLIPTLTVLDNVLAPNIPTRTAKASRPRALQLLTTVGLHGRENTLATRLSGGQQQRVAIARALINEPGLILADEPTGALDIKTGEDVIRLLFTMRDDQNATLVIATHNPDLAQQCDHIIHLQDGHLLETPPHYEEPRCFRTVNLLGFMLPCSVGTSSARPHSVSCSRGPSGSFSGCIVVVYSG
jgi:ABC-type lipoprotein export system ATPase subunit